ncbi:MAG: glycosyltransferase [Candidatus Bathyarchaeota archaeon]
MAGDLVSVIIPTRSRPQYLKEAIESVISQTYKNLEIIVADASDDDETEKLCAQYPVRYFKNSKGNTAAAMNIGIREMKGVWFKWLSDDDYFEPTALETLLEPNKPVVYSEYFIVNPEKAVLDHFIEPNYESWEEFITALWDRHIGNANTTIIHKSVIDKVGFFNEKLSMHEDYEYWLRIAIKHRINFHLIHKITSCYRKHRGMLTVTQQSNALKVNDKIRKQLTREIKAEDKRYWEWFDKMQRKRNRPKNLSDSLRYYGKRLPDPMRRLAIKIWRKLFA